MAKYREGIFKIFADHKWFYSDYDKTKKQIKLLGHDEELTTSMSPKTENSYKYNIYKDSDGYGIFVYQYYNLNMDTIDEIKEVFKKTFKQICEQGLTQELYKFYNNLKN